MTRLHVVEWFLWVPPALRPPGALGTHWDYGRKAYADPVRAVCHFDAVRKAGTAAAALAPADALGLQWARVSRHTLRADYAGVQPLLLCALLDCTRLRPPATDYPWRRDADRQPWAATTEITERWSDTATERAP